MEAAEGIHEDAYFKKEVAERLQAISSQYPGDAFRRWRMIPGIFASRCALRVMPLCGMGGDFLFWGEDAEKHIRAMEVAALFAGYPASSDGKVNDANREALTNAMTAAALAAKGQPSAELAVLSAADAVAASLSASTVSAAGAASKALAALRSFGLADLEQRFEAVVMSDLELLESGEDISLSGKRLWPGKEVERISSITRQSEEAFAAAGCKDTWARYEGILNGMPGRKEIDETVATWLEQSSPRPSPGPSELPSNPESTYVDPWAHNDSADPDDKLGYDRYADGLATFLLSEHTRAPLRISIEGPWGCGKSSFLLNLRNKLRKLRPEAKCMWFNPWRHDAGEALWAAFAVEFERQIVKRRGKFRLHWRMAVDPKNLPVILIALATLAVGLPIWSYAGLLPGSLSFLSVIGAFLLALWTKGRELWEHPLRADVARILKTADYGEKVSAIEKFHEEFGEMVAANINEEENERIFVFIDDLDRCSVPRSAELLESLTLLISPAGAEAQRKPAPIIFILGLDREKVAAGVAVKYEKLLPYVQDGMDDAEASSRRQAGLHFGYNFIEKFIELSYQLPLARPENIRLLLSRSLGWDASRLMPHIKESEIPADKASLASPTISMNPPTFATHDPSMAGPEAPVPETAPQSSAEAEEKAAEVKKLEESGLVGDIVALASPLFENNPRRIKQFINVLRLRAHLAAQTGILPAHITLPQLGKFVAVELLQPDFMEEAMQAFPTNFPRVWEIAVEFANDRGEIILQDSKRAGRSPVADFVKKFELLLRRSEFSAFIKACPPRALAPDDWKMDSASPLAASALAAPVIMAPVVPPAAKA